MKINPQHGHGTSFGLAGWADIGKVVTSSRKWWALCEGCRTARTWVGHCMHDEVPCPHQLGAAISTNVESTFVPKVTLERFISLLSKRR